MSFANKCLVFSTFYTFLSGERETAAKGVYEKWDKQDIKIITGSSTQPASSSHPQPQQYQGQRPSRVRGISRNALWLPISFHSRCLLLISLNSFSSIEP